MALLSQTERPSTVTLLESLLDAIVRLDGEALIMHVGEKPYVVLSSTSTNTLRGPLSWGQVELSSRPLSADAVLSMLGQMLSPQHRRLLDEIGAVEHEIAAPGGLDERFVVTARAVATTCGWKCAGVRGRSRGRRCPSRSPHPSRSRRVSRNRPFRPGGGNA